MSRLSTRVSIKWADDLASEPTDTLVMSVGSFYIDLRISNSSGKIDWAMAGERIVVSESPLKVRFTHIIDSRGYTAPDEGIFSKLPNGDDLEVGSMPCPERGGAITAYEEVWREFPAPKPGSTSWIVRRDEDNSSYSDGDEFHELITTFLGRIEDSYLAIRKRSINAKLDVARHEVQALTEEWTAEKAEYEAKCKEYAAGKVEFAALRQEFDHQTGEWTRKYEIGDQKLPYMLEFTGDEDLNNMMGKSTVELGGQEYHVCAAVTEEVKK